MEGTTASLRKQFEKVYMTSLKYTLNIKRTTSGNRACCIAKVLQPLQLAELRFIATAKRLRCSKEVEIDDELSNKLYRSSKEKCEMIHVNLNDDFREQKDMIIQ